MCKEIQASARAQSLFLSVYVLKLKSKSRSTEHISEKYQKMYTYPHVI